MSQKQVFCYYLYVNQNLHIIKGMYSSFSVSKYLNKEYWNKILNYAIWSELFKPEIWKLPIQQAQ